MWFEKTLNVIYNCLIIEVKVFDQLSTNKIEKNLQIMVEKLHCFLAKFFQRILC